MRVLVTGAGGQLGHELIAAFGGHDVVGADRQTLDVTDRDAVLAAIGAGGFDVVINAAAWTNVDACEADPARAFRCNALAVRHLAEGCRRFGAHLVQVSTDYVFDGRQEQPYTEWDHTDPGTVYGRSKLAGEREAGSESTVVRTSWLCGTHGSNIVKTVLRSATEHDVLSFVDDQRGNPTMADDLAGMILRLASDRRPGVVHVTNQGAVSWFEFAREVLLAAGLDPERVRPVASAELRPARPAPRPANSVLDNAVLRHSGIPLLDDFRIGLHRLVAALA